MSKLLLPHSDLNIRPLYYFLHVAEAGSFSKAASILSKDQPLLSKEIRQLEEQYGVQLFYRTGRGVALTKEGETLLKHARVILGAVLAAQEEMQAAKDVVEGIVTIAAPPLVGEVLNIDLVRNFRSKYPNVRLAFHEGFSTDILAWLAEGLVDLAVVYNAPRISTLMVEFLAEDDLWLVGNPNDLEELPHGDIGPGTLAELPLVIAPRPHKLRLLVEEVVHQNGNPLNVVNEVSGTATTLEFVSRRLGYTVLPKSLIFAAKSLAGLEARRLAGVKNPPKLYLVNSMQRPLTAAARQVMGAVKERFSKSAWPNRPEA